MKTISRHHNSRVSGTSKQAKGKCVFLWVVNTLDCSHIWLLFAHFCTVAAALPSERFLKSTTLVASLAAPLPSPSCQILFNHVKPVSETRAAIQELRANIEMHK